MQKGNPSVGRKVLWGWLSRYSHQAEGSAVQGTLVEVVRVPGLQDETLSLRKVPAVEGSSQGSGVEADPEVCMTCQF